MNQELRVYRVGDKVKANKTEYTILDREKNVIIMEEGRPTLASTSQEPGGVTRITPKSGHFEVLVVRTAKSGSCIEGRTVRVKDSEYLPPTRDWGVSAWTYTAAKSDRATALKAARRRMQWVLDGRKPENIGPILRAIFAGAPNAVS